MERATELETVSGKQAVDWGAFEFTSLVYISSEKGYGWARQNGTSEGGFT